MAIIFNDAFASVAWANKCTDEFEQMVIDFINKKPYALISESKSDEILHIAILNAFPVGFRITIAQVINNLRSALDLGWHALLVVTNTINSTAEAKFPFADNIAKFDSLLNRGFKNYPHEIKTLARSFQPYKGGDDLLWALNRICAGNKHRMLAPIGILETEGFLWDRRVPCPSWDRRENEIARFVTFPDENFNDYIDVTFNIAFNEVDIVKGQPVLTVLNTLSDKVQDILLALEAEAIRLGFIQIKT
jgi:hypothetical protein